MPTTEELEARLKLLEAQVDFERRERKAKEQIESPEMQRVLKRMNGGSWGSIITEWINGALLIIFVVGMVTGFMGMW